MGRCYPTTPSHPDKSNHAQGLPLLTPLRQVLQILPVLHVRYPEPDVVLLVLDAYPPLQPIFLGICRSSRAALCLYLGELFVVAAQVPSEISALACGLKIADSWRDEPKTQCAPSYLWINRCISSSSNTPSCASAASLKKATRWTISMISRASTTGFSQTQISQNKKAHHKDD